MARIYRRRRGKKLVGNWRQPLPGGGDHNTETTDAAEAERRGRIAVAAHRAGKRGADLRRSWSSAAAAGAAAAVLDPAREAEAAAAAQAPVAPVAEPAAPAADRPPAVGAAPPSPEPEEEEMSLDEAAAAAAAAAAGEDAADPDEVMAPGSARARFDAMVKGAKGAESIAAMLADLAAAAAIWGTTRGAELGWDLLLAKWTKKRLQAGPVPPSDDWSREFTRLSITLAVEESFPKLLDAVTPGWGILIGVLAGVGVSMSKGRLVDVATGASRPMAQVIDETVAAAADIASRAGVAPAAAPAPVVT